MSIRIIVYSENIGLKLDEGIKNIAYHLFRVLRSTKDVKVIAINRYSQSEDGILYIPSNKLLLSFKL